jgi:hypothetical protein
MAITNDVLKKTRLIGAYDKAKQSGGPGVPTNTSSGASGAVKKVVNTAKGNTDWGNTFTDPTAEPDWLTNAPKITGETGGTSSAPRWNPSPTRAWTCWRRCSSIPASG